MGDEPLQTTQVLLPIHCFDVVMARSLYAYKLERICTLGVKRFSVCIRNLCVVVVREKAQKNKQ